MAFPNVTLKDSFTGTGALSANWLMNPDPAFGMSTLERLNDAAAPTEDPSGNWWVAGQHAATVDIVADIKNAFEPAGTYIKLYFRLQNVMGGIVDGYSVAFGASMFDGNTTKIFLIRGATGLIIGQFDTGNAPLIDGSRVGIRVVGDDVECYIDYGGGVWVLETTLTTDGAVTGAGYAGLAWTQITPQNPA